MTSFPLSPSSCVTPQLLISWPNLFPEGPQKGRCHVSVTSSFEFGVMGRKGTWRKEKRMGSEASRARDWGREGVMEPGDMVSWSSLVSWWTKCWKMRKQNVNTWKSRTPFFNFTSRKILKQAIQASMREFPHIPRLKEERKLCLESVANKRHEFGILPTGFREN